MGFGSTIGGIVLVGGLTLGIALFIIGYFLFLPFLAALVIVHFWPAYSSDFWWIVLGVLVFLWIIKR